MSKCIDSSKIDIDSIVGNVFDLSKVGALAVQGVLSPEIRGKLVRGIEDAEEHFEETLKVQNSITKNMRRLYLEFADMASLPKSLIGPLKRVKGAYSEVYREISEKGGFECDGFNSTGMHCYPECELGIGAHRDSSRDFDLISIFPLEGQGRLYAGKTRDGPWIELDTTPGNLILLRAARNPEENKCRPFHKLEDVSSKRSSLIFRRRTDLEN